MKHLGKDASAADYWTESADDYAAVIDGSYHRHRLSVIRALLPDLAGKDVVDFGCGEGVSVRDAIEAGAHSAIGIDPNSALLNLARKGAGLFLEGGVDQLANIESADCLISANVLAYLTDEENDRFYVEAARLLRPGGHLVVTHSNNLFDLFTLNAFTVDFFRQMFGVDPSPLLANPDKPERVTYNIRENPLQYPQRLARYGFTVERMEYINHHARPPLLGASEDFPDTLAVPEEERWKLMFQCSTFGVRAVR